MIRESLADSNQIQWQVLAKSLQLQLADSRLWQILYIYSNSFSALASLILEFCQNFVINIARISSFKWVSRN